MTGEEAGRPAAGQCSPQKLKERHQEKRRTCRHEDRPDYVTRPVRSEINSGISDRGGNNKIEPAPAPKKEGAHYPDDHVVGDVSRRKGGPGFGVVGLIGNSDCRFPEKSQESGTGPFQMDHSHRLRLLGTPAIDHTLEGPHEELLGDEQGKEKAKDEGAPPKSHKNHGIKDQADENRLPDLNVAHRSHEQVERWTRPSFVDEMKNELIHESFEL
jgi:hypothetical protein